MLRPIQFSLVTFVLALSAFFGASAAAAQTLPPSLQGEHFNAIKWPQLGAHGDIDISGACTPSAGSTFTLTYRASGIATGPYPGTFTESGTVTAQLLTQSFSTAAGVVVTWEASFTIDSPTGPAGPATVTGTKTKSEFFPSLSHSQCAVFAGFRHESANDALTYEAEIKTATGTYTDSGNAFARVRHTACGPPACVAESEVWAFEEFFTVSTGVLPVNTSGKATGGGQVVFGSNPLEQVTFGFNVRKDDNETRLKGNCNVLDHATNTHVKCLTVTDYQQIGNTATWEGTAEVNGDREHYRITVQDNGEPNQGIDTFSIVTETYDAAGNVTHGNVQLHKQQLGL